jgi:hypothetical protein
MRALLSVAIGLALIAAAPSTVPTVAIGDIHGDLDAFERSLRAAGLTDAHGAWIGGRTVLVQTGDYMDRGPDVRAVLDRLMTLETAAAAAGGRVVVLVGNHEVMNLLGELRDVNPVTYQAFADERSEQRREAAWQDYQELGSHLTAGSRKKLYERHRDEWMHDHPPGYLEYREALSPRGRYGAWLRKRDVVTKVGDTIFMHAGLAASTAPRKLSDVNAGLRDEIRRFDQFVERLVDDKLALPSFALKEVVEVAQQTMSDAAEAIETARKEKRQLDRSSIDVELVTAAGEILKINTWSALDPRGPLWYRGFSTASEREEADAVGALLQRYDASRFVTAHTVTSDHRINVRFGGRAILIDTGMLASVYHGRPSALRIEGSSLTAVYEDQRQPLTGAPAAAR